MNEIEADHALRILYSGANSFVLHGTDDPSQKIPAPPSELFQRFSPDELIAVDNVPDAVFGRLDNIRANVKYLTLLRYSGEALQDPCAVFPMLEELVIIRSGMSSMELKKCKSIGLRKLWIRNYTPKAVAVSVAPSEAVFRKVFQRPLRLSLNISCFQSTPLCSKNPRQDNEAAI